MFPKYLFYFLCNRPFSAFCVALLQLVFIRKKTTAVLRTNNYFNDFIVNFLTANDGTYFGNLPPNKVRTYSMLIIYTIMYLDYIIIGCHSSTCIIFRI